MLKEKSIKKIKENQRKNKIKAFNNHNIRLKEKIEKINLEQRESRKLNSVIIGRGESVLHNYAKFITALVIRNSGYNIITEFPIDGAEIDVVSWELGIAVELQGNGHRESVRNSKLEKYQTLFDKGFLRDIFIIPLKEFSGNLDEDYEKIKEKLGL